MSKRNGIRILLLLLCLTLLRTSEVWGLVGGSDLFALEFNFSNPGARANGLGGAFIGLADDATAAYANPAGLTILNKSEVSIEHKYTEYTTKVTFEVGGSQDFVDDVQSPSFLSFVYPKENITFAIYRHQLVNRETNFTEILNSNMRAKIEADLKIGTIGVGAGLKATDTFSLGFSLGFAQLENFALIRHYNDETYTPPENHRELVDGEDTAVLYTFALLWNPFGEFNAGLIYRSGPDFTTTKSFWEYDENNESYEQGYVLKNTLNLPDVFGAGISYRIAGLTLAGDVNYIRYSDLLDDLILFDPNNRDISSDFDLEDAYEIHAGFEYALSFEDIPFAVRGGYYFRPDHWFIYKGSNPVFRYRAPEGANDHIFSLGAGVVLFGNVQIDIAGSYGDFGKDVTTSLVYRFK